MALWMIDDVIVRDSITFLHKLIISFLYEKRNKINKFDQMDIKPFSKNCGIGPASPASSWYYIYNVWDYKFKFISITVTATRTIVLSMLLLCLSLGYKVLI